MKPQSGTRQLGLALKPAKRGRQLIWLCSKVTKTTYNYLLIFTNTLDHVHFITAYLVFVSVMTKPQEVTSAGQEIVQQTLCKIATCQFDTFFCRY